MASPMFRLKITKKGKHPIPWIRDVTKSIYADVQDRLLDEANLAVQRMRNIIQDSIKRMGNTGTLQNSIGVDILSTTAGVHLGIGKISDMPIYWEVINDGGYVPPANRGFFAGGLGLSGEGTPPMAGVEGEQWIHTGSNADYYMNPRKPITPVRYVDIAESELRLHIQGAIIKYLMSLKNK